MNNDDKSSMLSNSHIEISGTCPQEGLPNMDFGALNSINLIHPLKLHICAWLYLGIGVLWLISSITLITSKSRYGGIWNSKLWNGIFFQSWECIDILRFILYFAQFIDVRYAYLRHVNLFLYFWILLTTAVSILDLGLGIALGLDYDTLRVLITMISMWINLNIHNNSYKISNIRITFIWINWWAANIRNSLSIRRNQPHSFWCQLLSVDTFCGSSMLDFAFISSHKHWRYQTTIGWR